MRLVKTLVLSVCAFVALQTTQAAEAKYPVSAIPEVLLKDAHAVVRLHEEQFVVKSADKGVRREKKVITILSPKGIDYATEVIGYDKLTKVLSFTAYLYDAQGKQVRKLKSSEFIDRSAPSSSLYDDNRLRIADLSNYKQYPFTVEFEYELSTLNMMFYPRFMPQNGEHLSVEKAFLEVSMPSAMQLRYKEFNIQQPAVINNQGAQTIYSWKLTNLAAFKVEPYSPPFYEQVPCVFTAPSEFVVEGYKGTMNTWKEFGEWQNKLNEGRDILSPAAQSKLKLMVADIESPEEKVKKVYEYLQATTRYISVQVGIGGWQPFDAAFVEKKGYGDCKALTNYTQAMLKVLDIPSFHADIYAGKGARDMVADFPSQQANHVILCVPLQNDTLWLECTSQQVPAGYMGSFTDDRYAMLVTPEGGKLVRTPKYEAADSRQMRKAVISVDEKGNAKATVKTERSGTQQDDLFHVVSNYTTDDQKKWLSKRIDIPDFSLNSFEFNVVKARIPSVNEHLDLAVNKCASMNGKRMFIKPNLMNRWSYLPPKADSRRTDVVLSSAWLDSDTVVYTLPKGYNVEFKPVGVKISSQFGEYNASVNVEGNKMVYIRTMSMPKGRFPAATFAEFTEFLKKVVKEDNMQVVLVAKES
jgi:hypothetical protein